MTIVHYCTRLLCLLLSTCNSTYHPNAVLLYTRYNDILLQLINIHYRVCLFCIALRQPSIDLGL